MGVSMTALDRSRPWSGALAAVATVVALVLAAWHLRHPIGALTMLARGGHWVSPWYAISYGRAAVWLLVGLAAALGWRILAAVAAVGAIVGEVVVAVTADPPVSLPAMAWRWLPDTAAALLLVAALATGLGLRRFAPLGRWFLIAGVLVFALSAAAIPLLGDYPDGSGSDFTYSFAIRSDVAAAVDALTVSVTAALVFASTIGLDPVVRRRALAVLAAGTAYLVVERLIGPRFGFSTYQSPDPQVVAGLAACVVAGLGLAWIALREHLGHRAGSAVESG
jgi:hypothetical protein